MLLRKKVVIGVVSLLFVISLFGGFQAVHANGWNPLVETGWLEKHLGDSDIKLVYVGFVGEDDKAKFEGKHIPGSTYLGMNELMGVMRGNNNAPDKTKFEALMGQLGISNSSRVILYGTPAGNPFVPGAYWMMKYFGHENAGILNGSLDKWSGENRKTESGAAKAGTATYQAKSPDNSIFVDAAYVLKNHKNENTVIIDTRGADEYKGEKQIDYIKAKGHIPGAVNMYFYPSNRNDKGAYKPAATLKKTYAGVPMDKEIITYCESGPIATDSYFALKEILGYKNVKVYVGSWMEWGNDEKYPVEK
jgi:thiosulfate/3-mercaptopyruvate sulfurtransferase